MRVVSCNLHKKTDSFSKNMPTYLFFRLVILILIIQINSTTKTYLYQSPKISRFGPPPKVSEFSFTTSSPRPRLSHRSFPFWVLLPVLVGFGFIVHEQPIAVFVFF